jgi:tetratricopeptide (TPR) repeat protein
MGRRTLLVVTAVLAAAASTPAPAAVSASDIGTAAKLCAAGSAALDAGNVDEGRKSFAKALEAVPDFPDAHLGLGRISMAEGRFEDALREFERARDAYGAFGDVLFEARMSQFNRTQDEIARLQDTLYQIQSGPSLARPSGGGATVLDQAKIENRIQQLQGVPQPKKEESADPPPEIFFMIGNAEFRLQRFDAASVSYEQCLTRNPKHLASYTNLALCLWRLDRIDDARAVIARAEAAGLRPDPKLKADLEAARKH